MASHLEFRAKTVDGAVEDACQELKLHRNELTYEVLSSGSSGIFGLVGRKQARIRVSVPGHPDDVPGGNDTEAVGEKSPGEEAATLPGEPVVETGAAGGNPAACPEAQEADSVGVCREALEKIVEAISPGATVLSDQGPERIEFDIVGGDPGIVIGKHGQTLEAVHYLVEKIASRRFGERIRIQVDAEGYLAKRTENLRRLADKQAEKARRTGRAVSMGPLNAHDRRIVHIALKADRDLRTQSIGSGSLRKLLVIPRRQKARGERNNRPDVGNPRR